MSRPAHAEIIRLVNRGLGVRDFSLAAAGALRREVRFDGVCVLTIDPATLLPTGEIVENALPADVRPRLTEIEIGEPDYNKFDALARAASPAASLSAATQGRLDDSLRQREVRRPNGFEDELRAVLVDDAATWGALTLLREAGRPHFKHDEVAFVGSMTRLLAEGLRRALLLEELDSGMPPPTVGMLILADDNSIELANAPARQLLVDLGWSENVTRADVPIVVHAVANRARRIAAGAAGDAAGEEIARVRVRARSGRWLVLHGSMLNEGPNLRAAVVLEAAHTPELAPLIASAYGLTGRERIVTQLVAQGFSTREIADHLHLSSWTVQDHLKASFAKTGTSSRGELVARLYFDHFAPPPS